MKRLLTSILLLPFLLACQSESMTTYKQGSTRVPEGVKAEELPNNFDPKEPEVEFDEPQDFKESDLPVLVAAPDLNGAFYGKVEVTDNRFVPKVDIVVVIDDSASMRRHISNLKRSIRAFVEALNKNDLIDFHVAVLPAWDSKRYGTLVKQPNFVPLGEFVPLVSPGASRQDTDKSELRFISKNTPNYLEVMKESLALEAKVFCCSQSEIKRLTANGETPVHNSPQFEEFFPQIIEALTSEKLNDSKHGFNRSFRRQGEHLSLVFFTDSDNHPESSVNAKALAEFLKKYTGDVNQTGLRLSTFAALHPTSRADTKSCPKDFDQKNAFEIEELINLTNPTKISRGRHSHIMDICSEKSFSSSLSKMGETLREQTMAGHEVQFTMAPLPVGYELVLCFGFENEIKMASADPKLPVCGANGQEIPSVQSGQAGWAYNSEKDRVVIRGYHNLKRPDQAELFWRLRLVR